MELKEALKIGKNLTKYFVYSCGEGEHYVSLVDRLRKTNTRSSVLKAIYALIRYGKLHLKQGIENVSEEDIDNLFQFIKEGKMEEVGQFHSALTTYIWTFEVEKIREKERYLLELLSSEE